MELPTLVERTWEWLEAGQMIPVTWEAVFVIPSRVILCILYLFEVFGCFSNVTLSFHTRFFPNIIVQISYCQWLSTSNVCTMYVYLITVTPH